MRKFLLAGAVSAAFMATNGINLLSAAIIEGPVLAVDAQGGSFTCGTQANHWTYKTTDKTVFRLGKKAASFADIKVGETVRVPKYHLDGQDRVAERVLISK